MLDYSSQRRVSHMQEGSRSKAIIFFRGIIASRKCDKSEEVVLVNILEDM